MTEIPDQFVSFFDSVSTGAGTQDSGAPADASVALTADRTSADAGDTVTFTVSAGNTGPGAATGLAVGIPLGTALSFAAATPSQGSYDPATGIWTIGTLAAAAGATLQLAATVTGQGWDVVTAQFVAETSIDPNAANNAATVGIALPPPSPTGQPTNAVVSTDGTDVAAPVTGSYNEEVVSAPVAGDIVTLQQGYQAVVLAGTAAATLVSTAFGGAMLTGNAGNDTIISAGSNDTLQAGAGDNILVAVAGPAVLTAAGQGGDNSFFSGAAAVTVQGGSGNDTAVLGSGGGVVNTGTGGSQVWAGTGQSTVNSTGAATIVGGGGASTVNVSGSDGVLAFGGSGKMQFNGGTGAATVVGLTGSVTVNGGTGGGTFFGGTAGNNVMNSGSGAAIMVGGGGGDVLNAMGSANDILVASSGAETLNGSASTGNNVFFGGKGSDCIVGGSGNDAIVAGPGNMTLTGAGGVNLFVFTAGATSTSLITDFDPSRDFVYLAGFGAGTAQAAIAKEIVGASSTILTLPDSTQITFAGVTNLSANSFV